MQIIYMTTMRRKPIGPATMMCCILLLLLDTITAENLMNTKDQELIKNSIDATGKLLTALSKFANEKGGAIAKTLSKLPFEKIANCLGVFGGFISIMLVLIPRESPELKYMKQQFSLVNEKLDVIGSKLDDMKSLFKMEIQKAQYMKEENNIEHGFSQLIAFNNKVMDMDCSTMSECKRQRLSIQTEFVKSFNVKQSMYMLFEGTYKTSTFSKPLFALIINHYKADIGQLNKFANRIYNLGFKGQQVRLMYEKLLHSNVNIMSSMTEWLNNIYKVRSAKYMYEEAIYKSIDKYINEDVKKSKYQTEIKDNTQAALVMRNDLNKRYNWLDWMVISYTPETSSYAAKFEYEHTGGVFVNNPTDNNKRKRVIFATPLNKKGTYKQYFKKFTYIIHSKMYYFGDLLKDKNPKHLINSLKMTLKNKGMWKMIRLLVVTFSKEKKHIKIAGGKAEDRYFERNLAYEPSSHTGFFWSSFMKQGIKNVVYILAVFKSKEEVDSVGCPGNCTNGNGRCIALPYTGTGLCACKAYYQGTNCETRTKTDIAENIQKMFATTTKIPNMLDLHIKINDLGNRLGTSLGNIQNVIVSLEQEMQTAFDKFGKNINKQFEWSNMINIYSRSLEKLKYTIRRFREVPKGGLAIKKLAKETLETYHIRYWLSKIKTLIEGRNDELQKHKPILHMVMDKYMHLACSDEYKTIVHRVWQQINILQLQGYLTWIQALDVLDRPTAYVQQEYEKVVESQNKAMKLKTCKLNVLNSVNGDCSGDNVLSPGMKNELKCMANTYLNGSRTLSCNETSQCLLCKCDIKGSISQQCDSKGTCKCKPGYKGPKCTFVCLAPFCLNKCKNRYTNWVMSRWSENLHAYSKHVAHCSGMELMKGFQLESKGEPIKTRMKMECCQVNTQKSCKKVKRNSNLTKYGGSAHYLNRQKDVRCNASGLMMGYHFKVHPGVHFNLLCCDVNPPLIKNMKCYTGVNTWTHDGGGLFAHLHEQNVSCKDGYYVNYFVLQTRRPSWRYMYKCCGFVPS